MASIKKLLAATAMLVLAGCAGMAQAPASDLQYQNVREVDLTKDQIFDKTQEWFARTFVDSKAVIEVANRNTGTIIGGASADIVDMMVLTPVRMTISVEAKPQRYRVTYDNYAALYEGSPYAVSTAGSASAITEKAKALDQSLYEYLNNDSAKSDDW